MSHFSMFVPTKTTVKLANGNRVHAQGIVIIVCRFPKCSIIIHLDQFIILHFTLPTPSHKVPSNFMLDFKRLCLNLLSIVILLTLKVVLGDHPTRLKTILTIFKYKFVKVNSHRDSNIVVPTVYALSRQNLTQTIYQFFCHVSITRLKIMARKFFMEDLPENLSNLE